MNLRILLVDDHAMVRAGLAQLLSQLPEVEVIGEAGDGVEALELTRSLQPDLVLMDIAMPKLNGLDACAALRKAQPDLRVVMLSMHREPQYVRKALQSGAMGYLLKDAAPAELAQALLAVRMGQTYLSPAVSQALLSDAVHGLRTPATAPPEITARQREVLTLVAQGLSTKEVALRLNLSAKTVDTHRTNLMNLLGIHDLAGLVRYAVRNGLVSDSA